MSAATLFAVSAFGPMRRRRRSPLQREVTAQLRTELAGLPAETVVPAGIEAPRPDSNPRISVHPDGAAVERDDAYAEIGYPRRKERG